MAEIIQLGNLDDTDKNYMEFVESLKGGNTRAVFIIEKENGEVAVGTTSQDRRDVVYDIFRLQQFCQQLVNEAE